MALTGHVTTPTFYTHPLPASCRSLRDTRGADGPVLFETNCCFISRTLLLSNTSRLVCKTSPTRAMSWRSVPLKCLPEAGLTPLPTEVL